MKKYILMYALLLAGSAVFAQERSGTAERMAERMKAHLSLSDDQHDRVRQIYEEFFSGMEALKSDSTFLREQALAERKRRTENRDKEILVVLTPEQAEKWKATRASHRDKRVGHKNPLEEMKTALGLSDAQAREIMAINRSMGNESRALRSDTAATRKDRATAMKEISARRNDKIKKVLTKEQYTAFLAFESEKKQHRRRGPRPTRH